MDVDITYYVSFGPGDGSDTFDSTLTLTDEEASATLKELLLEADGDYSALEDYLDRCEGIYYGEKDILSSLAYSLAEELEIQDYLDSHENPDEE